MNAKRIAGFASLLLVVLAVGYGGLIVFRQSRTARVIEPSLMSIHKKVIPTRTDTVAVVNNKILRESDLAVLAPASHDEALGLLVDFTLLDQEAVRDHVVVSHGELDNERRRFVGNVKGSSYANAAIATGRTTKGMDLQLRHALILKKLAARKVGAKQTGMFHARGILVKYDGAHGKTKGLALAYARRLQSQVEHGADISRLAKLCSEDDRSGPNGGDLGVISSFGAPNLVHQTLDFNMQIALAHQLGHAKSGRVLDGPIRGKVGFWVLKIVSTQEDIRGEQQLYDRVLALYRSLWTTKYEPLVMMHLRGSAHIDPPLDPASLRPPRSSAR